MQLKHNLIITPGNHGEDVKECYYYLDSTPTHSYMKALYKYPQNEYPYERLVSENRERTKQDQEFELTDTGKCKNQLAFFHLIESGLKDWLYANTKCFPFRFVALLSNKLAKLKQTKKKTKKGEKMCRDPGLFRTHASSPDLNHGPSDLQSDALPTELSRQLRSRSKIITTIQVKNS